MLSLDHVDWHALPTSVLKNSAFGVWKGAAPRGSGALHGWTDRWTDGQMDAGVKGWMGRQTDDC